MTDDAENVQVLPKAAMDVISERRRQIASEGWSAEHDDEHTQGEIAAAAACYAAPFRVFRCDESAGRGYEAYACYTDGWPWADEWWKPKDRRADLVRAGALILAEIERIDRNTTPTGATP